MMKDFDYNCYKFNQDLVELINDSKLPPTAIIHIIRDIMSSVSVAMESSIEGTKARLKKEKEDEQMRANEEIEKIDDVEVIE